MTTVRTTSKTRRIGHIDRFLIPARPVAAIRRDRSVELNHLFRPGPVQKIVDVLRDMDHFWMSRKSDVRTIGLSLGDRTPSMGVPLAHELRIVGKALRRSESHGIVLGPKSARLGVSECGHT